MHYFLYCTCNLHLFEGGKNSLLCTRAVVDPYITDINRDLGDGGLLFIYELNFKKGVGVGIDTINIPNYQTECL